MNFESFKFEKPVASGIAAAGYTNPTPIQRQAIPKVMQGHDVMGLAQTGTGKTAAFVLPILHRLVRGPRRQVRALVMAPTRELAEQIHEAVEMLGVRTGLKSAAIYGGVGIQPQIKALARADIVVACPGRLLDHINRGTVDLSKLAVLVIDEADQMFDMGFLPDIRRIVARLPQKGRQTLMFSATMPTPIRQLADSLLNQPVRVEAGHSVPVETVSHAFYPVTHQMKTALLLKLLGNTSTEAVLVFTRTKYRAKQLDGKLARAGFRSASLQGNLSQSRRKDAIDGFKSGKYNVLVATDIAARGIDVSKVSHVINFDMPATAETYIHRIGRTGRAERSGQAFTLITDEDQPMVKAIHRLIGAPVENRTLSDFDYASPPVSTPPARPVRNKSVSPKAVAHRSGQRPRRKEARGVFSSFSPRG